MDFGKFTRLVDEFPELTELQLQGLGEPMMHPRFFDMVAYAAAKGVKVGTNSNMTLLNARRAEQCVTSGLAELHVSIDGATAATYEGIRVRAHFDRVLRNVEMLLEARRLVERATRWLLRSRPRPLDVGAEIERFATGASAVCESLPGVLVAEERDALEAHAAELTKRGVPEDLARCVASLSDQFAALDIVGVAGATERTIDEVASLHFLVGGRLSLHWLRDRIATLPRENRWQAMARAALRDDLFSLHAELTANVLRGADADVFDVEARLDAWTETNRTLVERCHGILTDIRTGGTYDLTTLPVALRELRNLLQGSAAGAGGPA